MSAKVAVSSRARRGIQGNCSFEQVHPSRICRFDQLIFRRLSPSLDFLLAGHSVLHIWILLGVDPIASRKRTSLPMRCSAAAGPVGRTAEGATDLQMHAEILSYSRSRGLFAGVSLAGAMLRPDYTANFQFYRHVYEPREILIDGLATPPAAAKQLDDVLAQFSPRGGEQFPVMSQTDTKIQDAKTPAQGLVSKPATSH